METFNETLKTSDLTAGTGGEPDEAVSAEDLTGLLERVLERLR